MYIFTDGERGWTHDPLSFPTKVGFVAYFVNGRAYSIIRDRTSEKVPFRTYNDFAV